MKLDVVGCCWDWKPCGVLTMHLSEKTSNEDEEANSKL